MKKILSLIITFALTATCCQAQTLATTADSVSYIIGATMGNIIAQQLPNNYNQESFIKAFETTVKERNDSSAIVGQFLGATLAGVISDVSSKFNLKLDDNLIITMVKKALMGDTLTAEKIEELKGQIKEIENRLNAQKLEAIAKSPEAIKNKQNGNRFIAKKLMTNKYTRMPSGLMYRVITPGEGVNFGPYDTVLTKYKGSLITGEVVELEEDGREIIPAHVTPGCCEMLQLMKPGMKVEAIIPGNIAYGLEGNPQREIGPNQTLVFEIETIGLCDSEEEENVEVEE